jgi:hypothetical protein
MPAIATPLIDTSVRSRAKLTIEVFISASPFYKVIKEKALPFT